MVHYSFFRADNSATLVVPNAKEMMEAQHTIPHLSLHDLLWESFTFFFLVYSSYTLKNESGDSKRKFVCTQQQFTITN
jgi:hypothetical protein